jgi:hypothetical protein
MDGRRSKSPCRLIIGRIRAPLEATKTRFSARISAAHLPLSWPDGVRDGPGCRRSAPVAGPGPPGCRGSPVAAPAGTSWFDGIRTFLHNRLSPAIFCNTQIMTTRRQIWCTARSLMLWLSTCSALRT